MSSDWNLIESDPGVFTELIQLFGVEGVVMEEVFDLDYINSDALGLIFLFDYKKRSPLTVSVPGLFFANQVINNACATLSILHVIMNTVKTGKVLENLKEFVADFDPESKGISIGNCSEIRDAHNSFALPQNFSIEEDHSGKKEESFHFSAFIPYKGNVYELDGLLNNPVLVGSIENNDWINVAAKHLKERLLTNTKFNLMAVIPDPLIKLQDSADNARLHEELAKREEWKRENIRRRFNYWPLIFKLLEEKAKMQQ
eukprot:NODE_27_length_39007_cov_1.590650.p18 type:complete len:257 gc:universal NODE_27_length_39007_cov_1.590650:38702-37932(-)